MWRVGHDRFISRRGFMVKTMPDRSAITRGDRLKRMAVNFFGWAFAVNGGILFLSLFLLFVLGLCSLPWGIAFIQFTDRIHLEQTGYGVAILAGLFFAARWEIKPPGNLETYRYWLQTVMRYILAYVFLDYGFSKIFKGQFVTSPSTLEMPLGEISGFALAWRFFGYSYAY